MFALITQSVMKAVTRVFNPPRPTSLTTMLPREPSSKPITRLAQFSTSTGDNLLGMTQTVNGGGINPVHAQFERAMDGRDGLRVVLRGPPEFPRTSVFINLFELIGIQIGVSF